MAITVVGVGVADNTTPWAPTVAGPVLTNDLIVALCEQVGAGPTPAATGYAHFTGSPVNVNTSTQLAVLWLRSPAGGETAVTITGPSNHAATQTITLRGVRTTGNPWNVTPVSAMITTGITTATWPSVTTTVANCFMLFCIATGRDLATTANMGAMTGGTGLTNITERMDNWTGAGTGGGIGLHTADKAAAGATGAPTATMSSTDSMALMTIALEPAPAAAGPFPPMLMAPRVGP
jgi:hypothetical protein